MTLKKMSIYSGKNKVKNKAYDCTFLFKCTYLYMSGRIHKKQSVVAAGREDWEESSHSSSYQFCGRCIFLYIDICIRKTGQHNRSVRFSPYLPPIASSSKVRHYNPK